jgi:uncharacterized protein (DUF1330 family)
MSKSYWVGRITVSDLDIYQLYVAANAEAFAKYNGKFLARGGKSQCMEGNCRDRNVIVEFPDFETAVACWNSPEYQRAKAIREPAAEGDFVILEGLGQ